MMRTKHHQHNCDESTECGHIAMERNRYFTGKFMASRDFADEQTYFLTRHRLHNRLLHGWGIVCGLKVSHHPRQDCKKRWVVVQSGIALDCCGRELIVPCETTFELPLPREEEPSGNSDNGKYEANASRRRKPLPPEEAEPPSNDEGETDLPFLLVLRYVEEEIEHVPALFSEGECHPTRKEANRIREKVVLDVVRLDDVQGTCWVNPEGDPETPCRDDCGDVIPGPGRSCLKPLCPCGDVVPLALISASEDSDKPFDIDLKGRRNLPTPPEYLTHIVDTNWDHGEEVTLSQINNDWDRQLVVTFDRKLLPADGEKTGVSPLTFLVQYGGVQQALEFLPYDGDNPPGLAGDCRAVFTIDPDYIHTDRKRRGKTIVDNVVYVTLKCDFILDCHNNPVDGDFLRARFPTGNGVPGGVFESWFRVVHEDSNGNGDRNEGREENY
ncbi:MAG TPA: hypothetical protein VMS31_08580 [Pyrinomonadaceae bacterium]|nr:hypothetical protein [Pyrinomonadaceae bacterium]